MTDNPLVEAVGEAIFNVDVDKSIDHDRLDITLWNAVTREDEIIATYYGDWSWREAVIKHKKEQRALAALRAIEDAGYEIKKVGNPNLKS